MGWYFLAAGKIVFGLLVAECVFVYPLKHRKKFLLRCLSASLVFCLYTILVEPLVSMMCGVYIWFRILNFAIVLLLLIFQIWVSFDCSFITALSLGASAAATQHISSDIVLIGECFGLTSANLGEVWYNLYAVLVMLLLYAVFFFLFGRQVKQFNMEIKAVKNVVMSVFMILVIATLEMVARSVPNVPVEMQVIVRFYDALSVFVSLSMLYEIFSNFKAKLENAIIRQMLREKENYYELYKENIDIINEKCHNMKYILMGLHQGNGENTVNMASEIEKTINIYDAIAKTGNAALDVVLTEKGLYCEKHNITLEYIVDGKELNILSETDIYTVFGNALDNAIEHVELLEEQDKRVIDLCAKRVGELLVIQMNNFCKEQIVMKNGLPVTTKKDKNFHGYGIKSMRMIAEKYGGELHVAFKDGIFSLSIVIPHGNDR